MPPDHLGTQPPGRTSESGSSSASYAGILVVAVVVVLVLIRAVPGWGDDISCRIGSRLSSIGGGGGYACGAGSESDPEAHAPTEACVVGSREDSVSGSVSVAVTVEGSGSILVEEMSDGTYRVTDTRSGAVTAGPNAGGGVTVTVGDDQYGVAAMASAEGGAELGGGVTYTVGSASAKDDLVSYLTRRDTTTAVGSTIPGASLAAALVNAVADAVDGYTPPEPSEFYVEGGVTGNASAEAADLVADAQASADGSAVLGTRVNTETGEMTTYYRVDASADVSGTQTAASSGSAQATGEEVIAVTVSPDGDALTNVSFTGMYEADAGYSLVAVPFGEEVDGGEHGAGQVYQASVGLSAGETRSIAEDLLRSYGIPIPADDGSVTIGLPAAADALGTFVEAARDHGVLTRQDVDSDADTYGFDAELDPLVGFGMGGGYTSEDVTYSHGDYWDGSGWRTWEGC